MKLFASITLIILVSLAILKGISVGLGIAMVPEDSEHVFWTMVQPVLLWADEHLIHWIAALGYFGLLCIVWAPVEIRARWKEKFFGKPKVNVAFTDEFRQGDWKQHYRLIVHNRGALTARVWVTVDELSPCPPEVPLPQYLQPQSAVGVHTVEIAAGAQHCIDYFALVRNRVVLLDAHTVHRNDKLPFQEYIARVTLHADGMASRSRIVKFEIDANSTGKLGWVSDHDNQGPVAAIGPAGPPTSRAS